MRDMLVIATEDGVVVAQQVGGNWQTFNGSGSSLRQDGCEQLQR